jgi:hypothetical protein
MVDTNPFAALGWTDEEFESGEDSMYTASQRLQADNRICACGHPARAHASQGVTQEALILQNAGREQCRYGRMKCPCQDFDALLTSNDVRAFTFKTTGQGKNHALHKGVQKARKEGKEISWTKVECVLCARAGTVAAGAHLQPAAITEQGRIAKDQPAALNGLLCDAHIVALGGYI